MCLVLLLVFVSSQIRSPLLKLKPQPAVELSLAGACARSQKLLPFSPLADVTVALRNSSCVPCYSPTNKAVPACCQPAPCCDPRRSWRARVWVARYPERWTSKRMADLLRGHNVLFVGDSLVRHLSFAVLEIATNYSALKALQKFKAMGGSSDLRLDWSLQIGYLLALVDREPALGGGQLTGHKIGESNYQTYWTGPAFNFSHEFCANWNQHTSKQLNVRAAAARAAERFGKAMPSVVVFGSGLHSLQENVNLRASLEALLGRVPVGAVPVYVNIPASYDGRRRKEHLATQSDARIRRRNKELQLLLDEFRVPSFDYYSLTRAAPESVSYDGVHTEQQVGLTDSIASVFLSFLEDALLCAGRI